ncbi:MAG: MoaD/ThiS family protein [Chloroflexi bacterium]|nr:MoaD/ThiS family protein [Chloroflexota bacterium]
MATVHVPRSLAALIPGMPRTIEVAAGDVRSLVLALDRAHPGLLDRLCEPGPRIRPFINLFVDGTRADLDTPVEPSSVIHVVPAVAGG